MPKMKTHRGAAKRFKVTATGKFMKNPTGRRHLLEKKTAKRKRRMRSAVEVSPAEATRLRRMLPYP